MVLRRRANNPNSAKPAIALKSYHGSRWRGLADSERWPD